MEVALSEGGALPHTRTCEALGVSRATLHRRRSPKPSKVATRSPQTSPRALSTTEREHVVSVLNSPEFADQPPREVYAALLSVGIYLASVRTMYRLLAALGATTERRRGHVAAKHAMPQLEAYAPNEVWTWDITKVRGQVFGTFYYVFVVLDLFSRMVVGWMVAETENAKLAGRLLKDSIRRHGIEPGSLTVHSDRGSPMKAGSMTQLLGTLGVEQSFSRPRVSNDNPFVESSFKTAKYQPEYPDCFASAEHVRAYFAEYFDWYCEHHHHQGLALFTPAEVFHGRVAEVAAVRQAALDAQYDKHPERFVRGRPTVRLPPSRVHINLPEPASQEPVSPGTYEVLAELVETADDDAIQPGAGAEAQSGQRELAAASTARDVGSVAAREPSIDQPPPLVALRGMVAEGPHTTNCS
jgi:putative transposase